MKKSLFLIFLVIISISLFTGCVSKKPEVYKIIKSTYLYEEVDADSDSITLLNVGDTVRPANGNLELICQSTPPPDNIVLCRVEVIKTGQVGWVIEKWLDK